MTRTTKSGAAAELRPADIDRLATAVLEKLLSRIASASRPTTYSTRRGNGPPGMSDREAKRILPTVPGAVRRGRWTVVPVEAFDAWELAQATPSPPPSGPRAAAWSPDQALEDAGLRPTRTA